jgi:dual specificity phosphatase 12
VETLTLLVAEEEEEEEEETTTTTQCTTTQCTTATTTTTEKLDKRTPQPPPPPLKCKSCRSVLFPSLSHLSHPPSQKGQNGFEYRKRNHMMNPSISSCHVFLSFDSLLLSSSHGDVVALIQEQQVGKITCPVCQAKIGNFNLSGDQCSCGYLIWCLCFNPAF